MSGGHRPSEPPGGTARFRDDVLRALRSLQRGEVVTYAEVAAQAGRPGAARAVGTILRDSEGVPWWRVVTASGRLVPGHEQEQSARLRAEGIAIRDGRVARSHRARKGHT